MKTSIYTIYDSSRFVGETELPDIFEDYFDLETNDIPEFESDEYWQFNELVNCTEAEMFWNELNHSLLNDKSQVFLITGYIGWYQKRHKLKPTLAEGIETTITFCADAINSDAIEVAYWEGSLLVKTQHHDGENWFRVQRLTDKGISEAEKSISSKKSMRTAPEWFRPLQLNEIDF